MSRSQIAAVTAVIVAVIVIFFVARGPGGPSATPTAPAASGTPAAATATPQPTVDACAKANLKTKADGKLTIGTDNPAFPPYFEPRPSANTEPWDPEWGDPTTGEGFESAVAYAVAGKLGFTKDEVTWIVIPFNTSFAPGDKDFDLFINQVTFNADRAKNADLTDGYYFGNQTVVTMSDSKFAKATTLSALKGAKLGAQVGTTSLATIEDVIKTTAEAAVYNTTDDALEAMKNGQIDGVVVDLPTASFITTVQVEGSTIVGQIGEAAGAKPEHFSIVLEQGSSLTACVNAAIAALDKDGTLDQLIEKWLPFNNVPELKP
jgi:polar amino acid transport system substrate-binding protein